MLKHQVVRRLCIALSHNTCPVCQEPLISFTQALCEPCRSLCEPWLNNTPNEHYAYEYGGPVQFLLREIKYRKRHEWIELMPITNPSQLQTSMAGVHAIVPIINPIKTFHRRGFDLPTLIANRCAKILDKPVWVDGLHRTRSTLLQASQKNMEARINNVRGVFKGHPQVKHKHIMIVDDIRTTGATLESAKQALYNAGAAQVSLMALAKVR